ncbi:MAG: type II toxin-antitoxin system PemK/MazF family toxin, partial [Sulfuricellaceae bacterium]
RAHCRVANCLRENDHAAQFAPCIASRWEQSNPDNFPRARHISQLYTVDKSQLGEKIGALSAQRMREVLDGVALLLEPRELD